MKKSYVFLLQQHTTKGVLIMQFFLLFLSSFIGGFVGVFVFYGKECLKSDDSLPFSDDIYKKYGLDITKEELASLDELTEARKYHDSEKEFCVQVCVESRTTDNHELPCFWYGVKVYTLKGEPHQEYMVYRGKEGCLSSKMANKRRYLYFDMARQIAKGILINIKELTEFEYKGFSFEVPDFTYEEISVFEGLAESSGVFEDDYN